MNIDRMNRNRIYLANNCLLTIIEPKYTGIRMQIFLD